MLDNVKENVTITQSVQFFSSTASKETHYLDLRVIKCDLSHMWLGERSSIL